MGGWVTLRGISWSDLQVDLWRTLRGWRSHSWFDGQASAVDSTKSLFELSEVFQCLSAATFLFVGGQWRGRFGGRGAGGRFQAYAADVEVFFKAIGLKQVGQLEGADVAAALPNLPLQVNNHAS